MIGGGLDIAALERIAARAWPAARDGRIGDWRLYASSGYSGRINACWPLGDPGLKIGDAIAAVEAWYAVQSQPPLFKIVDTAASSGLIAILGQAGYRPRTETLMMTAPIARGSAGGVRLTVDLDNAFAEVFAAAGPTDPGDASERLEALARVPPPRAFAALEIAGRPAAIGAVAVEGEWAGVFAMRTDPAHRRQGLARRVLAALTGWAAKKGAARAWLQVEAANAAAISLYATAGFEEVYRYRYWERWVGPTRI